jgi:hypothetical protein
MQWIDDWFNLSSLTMQVKENECPSQTQRCIEAVECAGHVYEAISPGARKNGTINGWRMGKVDGPHSIAPFWSRRIDLQSARAFQLLGPIPSSPLRPALNPFLLKV